MASPAAGEITSHAAGEMTPPAAGETATPAAGETATPAAGETASPAAGEMAQPAAGILASPAARPGEMSSEFVGTRPWEPWRKRAQTSKRAHKRYKEQQYSICLKTAPNRSKRPIFNISGPPVLSQEIRWTGQRGTGHLCPLPLRFIHPCL